MACPCGCPAPVKPGNRYATSTCAVKARTPAQNAAAGRKRWKGIGKADRQQHMAAMIDRSGQERFEPLIDRWLQLAVDQGQPRAAIEAALKHGARFGYTKGRLAQRREMSA